MPLTPLSEILQSLWEEQPTTLLVSKLTPNLMTESLLLIVLNQYKLQLASQMNQEVIYKKDPNEEFLIPVHQIAFLKKEKGDKGAVRMYLTCNALVMLTDREADKMWNYFKEDATKL